MKISWTNVALVAAAFIVAKLADKYLGVSKLLAA